MILITVDPGSAKNVADHMDSVKTRIFAAVREGMLEGMQGLAETVAGKFAGNPLHSRSGQLLEAVLRSPKVGENDRIIFGSVAPKVGDKPANLDLWIEKGHEFPNKRKRIFESLNLRRRPDLVPLAAERAKASDRVAAHPFLEPSLREYGPTILEIIQRKVSEAVG